MCQERKEYVIPEKKRQHNFVFHLEMYLLPNVPD